MNGSLRQVNQIGQRMDNTKLRSTRRTSRRFRATLSTGHRTVVQTRTRTRRLVHGLVNTLVRHTMDRIPVFVRRHSHIQTRNNLNFSLVVGRQDVNMLTLQHVRNIRRIVAFTNQRGVRNLRNSVKNFFGHLGRTFRHNLRMAHSPHNTGQTDSRRHRQRVITRVISISHRQVINTFLKNRRLGTQNGISSIHGVSHINVPMVRSHARRQH